MAIPYVLDGGAAPDAAIGLVVLASDETVEPELARILPGEGAAIYQARIPFAPNVTAETLARMAQDLPRTVGLLPDRDYGVIGYACTSGATVIGSERIAALVQSARRTAHVTDPLRATIDAARALGVRRLGFLTPYVADVSAAMRLRFEEAGLEIAAFASFEEETEATVARISEASTFNAIRALGAETGVEAVFASCTNLRSFGIIAAAEATIERPVLSSNLTFSWSMCRLSGTPPKGVPPGMLWQV